MSVDSGKNEKILLYDDLTAVVKRGDLLQTSVIEDRVYLVLDKAPSIPGSRLITLLSPEGKALTGYTELWGDIVTFYYENQMAPPPPTHTIHYRNIKFSIIQSTL